MELLENAWWFKQREAVFPVLPLTENDVQRTPPGRGEYICCRKTSHDCKDTFTLESPALPLSMLLAVTSPRLLQWNDPVPSSF